MNSSSPTTASVFGSENRRILGLLGPPRYAYMPKKRAALPDTVGPSSRSGERTPPQNFLKILTERSALQRIEMALKPQKDREMRSLEGSNPPFSTIQSLSFRTSRRIDRNPRACARFASTQGPGERPMHPVSPSRSQRNRTRWG
jgi:hypothetical protein